MKKILFIGVLGMAGLISSPSFVSAASPTHVVLTAPATNELAPVVVQATGSVSAVTVSSFTITRIDTAFNAAALSAIGAAYQRAEITVQNNDTTDKFCGYSASGLTISNSFRIYVGASWVFSLGKAMPIYCLNAAGSSGTLIVGGIAWKQ